MKHGKFTLPKNHRPFMKVAKGGSNCANCKFLTADKKHCGNTYFVTWYGTSKLPQPISRYCSDWYEPSPEYMANGGKITPSTGKPIDPINAQRFAKKREHAEQLSNSIQRLRSNVTKDLKSDDEKTRLTALVIAIIDKTAERVGNETSEDAGHFGITGLRKKHVTIDGNTVKLNYIGKSGVEHSKQFTDELIAKTLKQAIKDSPDKSIFVTSDGFKIKADRVNRYLSDYNISAKDIRGHHANKYIIDKLHKQEIPSQPKDRKMVFKKAVRYSADKVGHKSATLQKHYLFPELETEYVSNGKIIDLSDFYSGGGEIEGPSHEDGGIPMIVKPGNEQIEVEGGEYYICKDALLDETVYEFTNKTNKEILDQLFSITGCKYDPNIAHANDFIVCKLAVQDKEKRNVSGTIQVILNTIQGHHGCTLTNNNQFSDNIKTTYHEDVQRAKKGGDIKNSESNEGDKAKRIRIGNRVPKERRLLSERAKEALAIEPKTPYEAALQYFIGRGQLHPSAIKELYGGGRKNPYNEHRARIGYISNKGKTIEGIAHYLWETQEGSTEGLYDETDYRNAVEQVVNNNNSVKSMIDDLLELNKKHIEEDYYYADIEDHELMEEAADYFSELSPEEQNIILIETQQDVEKYLQNNPEKMEYNAPQPDYMLDFDSYVIKHNISDTKKSLAKKQWIKSVKDANEKGLYEKAIMKGTIEASEVYDLLDSAGIEASEDIKKLAREEYKIEINKIKAEHIISAKEIKKTMSKQEVIQTIEGLKILEGAKSGKDKINIENTIKGLEIFLERMPDTMEKGGYILYKEGIVVEEIYN